MAIFAFFDPPSSRSCKKIYPQYLRLLLLLLAFVFGGADRSGAGSVSYKNYLVRYDRGWDILCEPYVVQKGDWVLKIFRQKGEISQKDFRDFLGIFQRLNPHVPDIDLVRPGQTIDIPLRKLEHGSLPGQASGLVSIPFVSLAKVVDVLHQNMPDYKVQSGDTISQLVAARFGRYGSRSYQEGLKLLQAANPQIADIDHIYAGQVIHMPDPSIRGKEWYQALYNDRGDLRETVPMKAPAVANQAEPASPSPAALAQEPDRSPQEPADILAAAAAAVGGKLLNKGTFFAPLAGSQDFEIDLSRNPMLDLQGQRMFFARDGKIMNQSPEPLQESLPEIRVVPYESNGSVQQVVGDIFKALNGPAPAEAVQEESFEEGGVSFAIHSKWRRLDAEQRRLCISPIGDPSERTPEPMRRYLEQHGIVLREILPNGSTAPAIAGGAGRHAVKDILALTYLGQRDFVQRLTRALGFSFTAGVTVTYPYAGVQMEAALDLVSTPQGQELLIDFGELYGDALPAIRQSGHKTVQIAAEDKPAAIAQNILEALAVPFTANPAFTAAGRPGPYNTFISVAGLLCAPAGKKQVLLSAALPPAVSDLISAGGIAMVNW